MSRKSIQERKILHTKYFGDIAIGVGLVVSAGASAYGAYTSAGTAAQASQIAQTQQSKQNTSFNQLQTLINNPQSFFDSPVYKAAFNQGTQAVNAQQNAGGFLGSSNAAGALQSYGQSFGQQQLLSQETLLAGMSGTQFNPAGATQVAGQANQQTASDIASIGGLLSFFGSSGGAGIGSGGGGGNSGGTPLAGMTQGGYILS